MPDLKPLRVVILGGGPAGLAVARLLALRGLRPSVFERDAGPNARTQGGSLDLTEGRGLRAIAEMGLGAEFDRVARPQGQDYHVLDQEGNVHLQMTEETMGTPRPEIDRTELRRILLASLPEGVVAWGCRTTALRPVPGGGHAVEVAHADGHGESVAADLVIAADGIWSIARDEVTAERPRYIGVTYVHGDIQRPDPSSWVSRTVGQGASVAVGTHRSMGFQRNGDGSIRVYFMISKGEHDLPARGSTASDRAAMVGELHEIYAAWSPRLRDIIDKVTGDFAWWPIYTLPAHQEWGDHQGLTLVGDAAHVMPPFTGQGVNHGLLDAVELVTELTSDDHATVDEAIAVYERRMLTRMAPEITKANSDDEKMMSGIEPVLARLERERD